MVVAERIDTIDDDECTCTCEGEPLVADPEDCEHEALRYCKCCGKVYCLICGCKWGCSKCAGAIDC